MFKSGRLVVLSFLVMISASAWGKPSLPVSSVPKSAPENIRIALNNLYSTDADVIGDALIVIQEKGTVATAAIPYLISMLDDETSLAVQGLTTVADEAAEALVKIGLAVQLKVLESLKSGSPDVRVRCAYVLGQLRDPAPVYTLDDMVKNESVTRVRVAVINALGLIKSKASIVHLLMLLNDPDDRIADAAVAAIANFGYPAIKPLTYNLKSADAKKEQMQLALWV